MREGCQSFAIKFRWRFNLFACCSHNSSPMKTSSDPHRLESNLRDYCFYSSAACAADRPISNPWNNFRPAGPFRLITTGTTVKISPAISPIMIYRLGTTSDTATQIESMPSPQALGLESMLESGTFDRPPRLQLDRGPAAPPASAAPPRARLDAPLSMHSQPAGAPPSLYAAGTSSPSAIAAAGAPTGTTFSAPAMTSARPDAVAGLFAPTSPSAWQSLTNWWSSTS